MDHGRGQDQGVVDHGRGSVPIVDSDIANIVWYTQNICLNTLQGDLITANLNM